MTERRFDTAGLEEIETVQASDRDRMRSAVRQHFDIGAFGVNAFSSRQPGSEIIAAHDERSGGADEHEELYLVLRGHARFTVDGEEVDAPEGTFVFVREPAARRSAVAIAPETTVLVVGGPRGKPFRVAAWEYAGSAFRYLRDGDFGRAQEIFEEGLREYPDDAGLLYNMACAESLAGYREEAVGHLRQALERDGQVREWARDDTDLDPIRGDSGFPF